MSNLVKSHWSAQGDVMHIQMPLSKVDTEHRLVSGFATLDNVDSQGDVVSSKASVNAFTRARGNIREQHDESKAVGKMVDFREDEFFDPETKKFYSGVYVTAYISKGAEDTWQKVLDGTLSGFSIGGSINDYSNEINKESGSAYRLIKDYDLTELSLVDNPANHLANVFSIQKSADGSVKVEGMVAETQIENVFYCEKDGEAQSKPDDSATCLECGDEMKNIGWFEVVDDRIGKVKDIVDNFVKSNTDDADEGGVTMAKKKEDKDLEKSETTEEQSEEVEEVVEDEEVDTEKSEDVEEVEDDEDRINKTVQELHQSVQKTLDSNRQETQELVEDLKKKIDELDESFNKRANELESKLSDFDKKLDTAKSRLADFEKSLNDFNKSTAVKKSSDVESEQETVKKSKWNGAFSVDNLL